LKKKPVTITLRNEEKVKWFEDDMLNRILTQCSRKVSKNEFEGSKVK
jgi:hypothetical protein